MRCLWIPLAAVSLACARPPPVLAPSSAPEAPPVSSWESAWLEQLGATDGRLALRMPVPPRKEVVEKAASQAVVRGDEDVGVVGGAIDVFSFKTRETRLASLRAELPKAPKDEVGLLVRLLDAEDQRLRDERNGPEMGSELVRGMVATWGQPSSASEVEAREHSLVRGLSRVTANVMMSDHQGARIAELEDALDGLERLVAVGYPHATMGLAEVRMALERAHRSMGPDHDGPPLEERLAGHLGVHDSRQALTLRLQAEEARLRTEVKTRLAAATERAAALEAAATHVGLESPCDSPHGGEPSLARALRPPPERALLCDPLKLAAASGTTLDDTVESLALHDDVAIALWALALDHSGTALDVARAAYPLLASVPEERKDRLARSALVSPVRAITVGLMAAILDDDGPDHRRDRAQRWVAFGDAPLDVVSAYLARPR